MHTTNDPTRGAKRQPRSPQPAPEGAQFAQANAVCLRFGFSRVHLWRLSRDDPKFPKPRRMGPRLTLYDVQAIEEYIRAHGAGQRAGSGC